jgi:hypothetical protein
MNPDMGGNIPGTAPTDPDLEPPLCVYEPMKMTGDLVAATAERAPPPFA